MVTRVAEGVDGISENFTFAELDYLFKRVSTNEIDDDDIPTPKAFSVKPEKNGERHISTDWSRLSTPRETRLRATQHGPEHYSVAQLQVLTIKSFPRTSLNHSPIPRDPCDPTKENPAHTDIIIEADISKELRTELKNLFVIECRRLGWAIHPHAPVA